MYPGTTYAAMKMAFYVRRSIAVGKRNRDHDLANIEMTHTRIVFHVTDSLGRLHSQRTLSFLTHIILLTPLDHAAEQVLTLLLGSYSLLVLHHPQTGSPETIAKWYKIRAAAQAFHTTAWSVFDQTGWRVPAGITGRDKNSWNEVLCKLVFGRPKLRQLKIRGVLNHHLSLKHPGFEQ